MRTFPRPRTTKFANFWGKAMSVRLGFHGMSTAAPDNLPDATRRALRLLHRAQRFGVSVRTGTCGASSRNSSPSRRVRFATERDCPLLPYVAIRKRGDVAHVISTAYHRPAGCKHAQSGRHKLSYWREDNGGIKFLRRCLIRAAGPDGAEPPREILCCRIARTRERENLASLITRHLHDDAPLHRNRKFPVASRLPLCAASGIRSTRRRVEVPRSRHRKLPELEAKSRVGNSVFRISTVDRVAVNCARSQRFSRPERQ